MPIKLPSKTKILCSPTGKRTNGGFTLLEVLVSLAILGIAITVIFQLFSANLRALTVSEDYVTGVLEAQAKMREIVSKEELEEKSLSGLTPSGYRYEVSITQTLSERSDTLPKKLVEVVLKLFWYKGAKEKSLILRSLKMIDNLNPVQTAPARGT
jgi:prepilin-type N-terminal cleavage/methylation domain-containing protein